MAVFGEKISRYFEGLFGVEFLKRYEEYIDFPPETYIRNGIRDEETLLKELTLYDIGVEKIPDVTGAFRVTRGHELIGRTYSFILGHYYIQSLSSMIPPIALDPQPDEKILDMCAAPGSKTTQIALMMENRGALYANEPVISRTKSLVHNLEKMTVVNTGALNFRGELLSKMFNPEFDKILVDAPCSALGILNKKDEVDNWWNISNAEKLSATQYKLLVSALKMLKEGGEIIYSTCTMTIEENELVLDRLMKKFPVEIVECSLPVKSIPGFTTFGKEKLNSSLSLTHRIIPWEINSEGFFVAKLRKTGPTESPEKLIRKKRGLKLISHKDREIKESLNIVSDRFGIPRDIFSRFRYMKKSNDLFFINSDWEAPDPDIFMRIGTKLGIIDKNNYLHFHTQGTRIIGDYAKNEIFDIDDIDDLKAYLSGGIIRKKTDLPGKKFIRLNGEIIGAGTASDEGIKSQFPRSLRTQEIVYPEKINGD